MTNIRDFMARDHHFCDGIFERAERLVADGDWHVAATAFAQYEILNWRKQP